MSDIYIKTDSSLCRAVRSFLQLQIGKEKRVAAKIRNIFSEKFHEPDDENNLDVRVGKAAHSYVAKKKEKGDGKKIARAFHRNSMGPGGLAACMGREAQSLLLRLSEPGSPSGLRKSNPWA